MGAHGGRLRRLATDELADQEVGSIRKLLNAAFAQGGFTDDDWMHALGGVHFLLDHDGVIVAMPRSSSVSSTFAINRSRRRTSRPWRRIQSVSEVGSGHE